MDMWLDQQNPLTLSPEAVKAHLEELKRIRKRRKQHVIQSENSNVITVRTENTND